MTKEAIGPCALMSSAQASQLTGGPVKKPLVTSTGASCSYAGATSLLLTDTAFVQRDWDAERSAAIRNGATLQVLNGIGDEAFAYSAGNQTVQSAQARIGDRAVGVLISGPKASSAAAIDGLNSAISAAR